MLSGGWQKGGFCIVASQSSSHLHVKEVSSEHLGEGFPLGLGDLQALVNALAMTILCQDNHLFFCALGEVDGAAELGVHNIGRLLPPLKEEGFSAVQHSAAYCY